MKIVRGSPGNEASRCATCMLPCGDELRRGRVRGVLPLDPQDVPVVDVNGPLDESVAVGSLADHESLSHGHALVGVADVELRPVSQDQPEWLERGAADF